MPQLIEVPGEGMIEFPDSMNDDQIVTAIKGLLKPKPEAPLNPATDFGGLPVSVGGLDTGLTYPESLGNFVAGAGRSAQRLGQGLGQIADSVADVLSPREQWLASLHNGARVASRAEERGAQVAEETRLSKPLTDTTAGTLGTVAGELALTALPVSALGRVGAAARLATAGRGARTAATVADGAVQGAALGAAGPVEGEDTRLGNAVRAAAFGAGGNAGIAGLGVLAAPFRPVVDATRSAAVAAADRLGIPLTLSQRSGSKVAAAIESAHDFLPGSAGFMQGIRDEQQNAVNNLGEQAAALAGGRVSKEQAAQGVSRRVNTALEGLLGTGDNQGTLGLGYRELYDGRTIPLDTEFAADLGNVAAHQQSLLPAHRSRLARNTIDEALGTTEPNPALEGLTPQIRASALAQGVPERIQVSPSHFGPSMTGQQYQSTRSILGKAADSAVGPDAYAAGSLQSAFDNAAQRALSPADQMTLGYLNNGYRLAQGFRQRTATAGPEAILSGLMGGGIHSIEMSRALLDEPARALVGRRMVTGLLDDAGKGNPGNALSLLKLGNEVATLQKNSPEALREFLPQQAQGLLGDLRLIGQSFGRRPIGDSGTAQRAAAIGFLSNPLTATTGTLAGAGIGSATGLGLLAYPLTVNGLSRVMQSPSGQRLLTGQTIDRLSPAAKRRIKTAIQSSVITGGLLAD